VAGVREKLLAAQRAGVKVVVFPKGNEVDLKSLEEEVKGGLQVVLADDLDRLADLVLLGKES
jgi:ATP-dependent Lon protease